MQVNKYLYKVHITFSQTLYIYKKSEMLKEIDLFILVILKQIEIDYKNIVLLSDQ